MKYPLFFLLLLSGKICAQSVVFHIDTTNHINRKNQLLDPYFAAMEWKINGQILNCTSGPVRVPADKIYPDTLLYKSKRNADWDTILCFMQQPGNYQIQYNTCCMSFDVLNAEGKRTLPKLILTVQKNVPAEKYLGILGESGIWVNNTATDTLQSTCRSPMLPNIYPLIFGEVKTCIDTSGCETVCLQQRGVEEWESYYSVKRVSRVLNTLYVALSNNPVHISVDPETGEITLLGN